MHIPEEKINLAKERVAEPPKAKTVEIQTVYRYVPRRYDSPCEIKIY